MVTLCWLHGLVVHVQFWSSPNSLGPTGGLRPKKCLSVCLKGLIVVLICRIHDLDVQCASLVQSKISLPLPSPLFATEKIVS